MKDCTYTGRRSAIGAKSPELSRSFYSAVNGNSNDMVDMLTERKKLTGSVGLKRSVSRDNMTIKNIENRINLKIDQLSDKHEKFIQKVD